MKLFYQLFISIFFGVVLLISVDSYLSYQTELAQYEADMVANAQQDGRSLSGLIAHVWRESGPEQSFELIREASDAGGIDIRWRWFDELSAESQKKLKEQGQLASLLAGGSASIKMNNKNGALHRYTYVAVDVDGKRRGGLELEQTLYFLHQYSRDRLLHALTLALFFAFVSGIILYAIIDIKVRTPLGALMAQARAIARGEFSGVKGIGGRGEFAKMSGVLSDMSSRLLIAKDKIEFEHNARLKTLEQLRHTERLSTFGLLAAEIAHELGTPLNVVDGRAKMIVREDLSAEETEECAVIIQKQAERMAVIIRQLLEFTRAPKQQVEVGNIHFLLKQIVQILQPIMSKQSISVQIKLAHACNPSLSCDAGQIQQVFMNLLMNSAQAMQNGGKIYLDLATTVQGQKNYLRVDIRDEGEGISREDLAHIFTPFFTTKGLGTGTGLGLSIAHGIVEEHGGWIDVESERGKGTHFTLYLPGEGVDE